MKKTLSSILITVIFAITSSYTVFAEETEPVTSTGITVSPGRVIMQINDYGKTYAFTIENNSGADVNFIITEGLITQTEEGTTMPLNEEVTKSFVEILTPEVSVKNGASAEIKVRSRIIGNDTTLRFPAIIIKAEAEKNSNLGINYEMYIPFIAQNTNGILSMNAETSIDANAFSFNPTLKIDGKITNDGDKFYNPSGTIAILKDGVKINETEITTQITGLLLPERSRSFTYTWVNDNADVITSFGEYTIETRVTSDISDKIYGSRINFFYIPMNLIYIVAGIILLLVVIVLTIKIVKSKQKKATAY